MRLALAMLCLCSLSTAGCHLPGRPPAEPEVPRPEEVMSFPRLYGENCAGCHGVHGDHGPATDLSNPEYQALIDDASLHDVIANGEQGSLMPAFAEESGGNLTQAQVDVIVRGLRSSWAKPGTLAGVIPPPWKAGRIADPSKGQAVYAAACAHCHGATAEHPGPAGSILDGSFLALVNEQTLRTTVIAGRPDIGQPDWRNLVPGRALTDEDISAVTAWLISRRPPNPGRPYPDTRPTSERPGEQQPPAVKNP